MGSAISADTQRKALASAGSMSLASPDHTAIEISMMFMAAKPATATRRKQIVLPRVVAVLLGGLDRRRREARPLAARR